MFMNMKTRRGQASTILLAMLVINIFTAVVPQFASAIKTANTNATLTAPVPTVTGTSPSSNVQVSVSEIQLLTDITNIEDPGKLSLVLDTTDPSFRYEKRTLTYKATITAKTMFVIPSTAATTTESISLPGYSLTTFNSHKDPNNPQTYIDGSAYLIIQETAPTHALNKMGGWWTEALDKQFFDGNVWYTNAEKQGSSGKLPVSGRLCKGSTCGIGLYCTDMSVIPFVCPYIGGDHVSSWRSPTSLVTIQKKSYTSLDTDQILSNLGGTGTINVNALVKINLANVGIGGDFENADGTKKYTLVTDTSALTAVSFSGAASQLVTGAGGTSAVSITAPVGETLSSAIFTYKNLAGAALTSTQSVTTTATTTTGVSYQSNSGTVGTHIITPAMPTYTNPPTFIGKAEEYTVTVPITLVPKITTTKTAMSVTPKYIGYRNPSTCQWGALYYSGQDLAADVKTDSVKTVDVITSVSLQNVEYNTDITFTVTTVSKFKVEDILTAPKSAPTSVTATQKTGSRNVEIKFFPNPSTDKIIEYQIYRSATSFSSYASATKIGTIAATGTDSPNVQKIYTDTGLTSDGTYYYAVVAKNTIGLSGTSNVPSATVNTIPAAPVLNALPATTTTGLVSLSWAAVSGATKYDVYRSTSSIVSTTGLSPITTVTSPSHVDNMTVNGLYFYAITAGNTFGFSTVSNSKSITVAIPSPPAPPTPVAPSPVTVTLTRDGNNGILVQWSASTGATSYSIYRRTQSGFSLPAQAVFIANKSSSIRSYFDSLSTPDIYYYGVTANNATGQSSMSNTPYENFQIEGDYEVIEVDSYRNPLTGSTSGGDTGTIDKDEVNLTSGTGTTQTAPVDNTMTIIVIVMIVVVGVVAVVVLTRVKKTGQKKDVSTATRSDLGI